MALPRRRAPLLLAVAVLLLIVFTWQTNGNAGEQTLVMLVWEYSHDIREQLGAAKIMFEEDSGASVELITVPAGDYYRGYLEASIPPEAEDVDLFWVTPQLFQEFAQSTAVLDNLLPDLIRETPRESRSDFELQGALHAFPLCPYGEFAGVAYALSSNTTSEKARLAADFIRFLRGEAQFPPCPKADLELATTADKKTAAVGTDVTFSVAVINQGPDTAIGIVVDAHLPSGYKYLSHTATHGSYRNGSWSLGDLATGTTATLTITEEVLLVGDKKLIAEIVGCNIDDPDSTPNNHDPNEDDQDSVTTTFSGGHSCDLELSLRAYPNNPYVTSSVQFTVEIYSRGPRVLTAAMIEFALPNGYEFQSSSVSSGKFDSTRGTWTLSIFESDSETLQVTAKVRPSGNYEVMAEIIVSDTHDPDSTPNNQEQSEDDYASVQIRPQLAADIALSLNGDSDTIKKGDTVTWTLTAENKGPHDVTDLVIEVAFSDKLAYVSSSEEQTYDQLKGIWKVGNLKVNSRKELTIKATATTAGDAGIWAEVKNASEYDPIPRNDTASLGLAIRGEPPTIEFIKPAENADVPAWGFTILLKYRPGDIAIDSSSLRITCNRDLGSSYTGSRIDIYWKGWDIQDLFEKDQRKKTAAWKIPKKLRLPEGETTFTASIKDMQGNKTSAKLVFHVESRVQGFHFINANGKIVDQVLLANEEDGPAFGFYVQFVSSELEDLPYMMRSKLDEILNFETYVSVYTGNEVVKKVKIKLFPVPGTVRVFRTRQPLFVSDEWHVLTGARIIVPSEKLSFWWPKWLRPPSTDYVGYKTTCKMSDLTGKLTTPAEAKVVAGVVTLNTLSGTIWEGKGDLTSKEHNANVEFTLEAPQSLQVTNVDLELLQDDKKELIQKGSMSPSSTTRSVTFSWSAAASSSFPFDPSKTIQARLLLHSQRGSFYSQKQDVVIRTPSSCKLSPESSSFNPLLDYNRDGLADSLISVEIESPGGERDYDLTISFTDVAGEVGSETTKHVSLTFKRDSRAAVGYDTLHCTALDGRDWAFIHEYLCASESMKYAKRTVSSEYFQRIEKTAPHVLEPLKAIPDSLNRRIHVDIKSEPTGHDCALTICSRATIEVKPAFSAQVDQVRVGGKIDWYHPRITPGGKVEESLRLGAKWQFTTNNGWIEESASTLYGDQGPVTIRNEAGALVTRVAVRPDAEITLVVKLKGRGGERLGDNLPIRASIEGTNGLPAVFTAGSNNRDSSVTAYTEKSFITLKCKVPKEATFGEYSIKLNSSGNTLTIAELNMCYATVDYVRSPGFVNKGERGVFAHVGLIEKDVVAKMKDKADQELVETHVQWFIHDRPDPRKSWYIKRLGEGSLYAVVDIEDKFLDTRTNNAPVVRDGYDLVEGGYDLVYITAVSSNAFTTYIHVKDPQSTGECPNGIWVLKELTLKGGFGLSYVLDIGGAVITWKATCMSCPKLQVTGAGYLFRWGLGMTVPFPSPEKLPVGAELVFKERYSGVISGVDNAEQLTDYYTGLLAQAGIPGMGTTGIRAWQSYDGPMIAFWKGNYWSLSSVFKDVVEVMVPSALTKNAVRYLREKPLNLPTSVSSIAKLFTTPALKLAGVCIILTDAKIVER